MAIERNPRALGDTELLGQLRALVHRGHEVEADLVEHLAEVDARRLYLPRRTSLWDFCIGELGFSDDAACNRIAVARESRRFPQMIAALRTGRLHLSGLKMLCGSLTPETCDELLAEASGKTRREIAELLARRQPKPAVPDAIRKLPSPAPPPPVEPPGLFPAAAPATQPTEPGPTLPIGLPHARPTPIAPLSAESYKVQFTANRELREKIRQAQDLLRHQLPSGDLASIVDRALTLLITQVKKDRWAIGRRPRSSSLPEGKATSRDVPDAIKRVVYERDGGRCTYVDPDGHRCDERGWLELDHVDGFPRTQEHRAERIRLLCRAHNTHAADEMYGRDWMDEKKRLAKRERAIPGDSEKSPR